MEEEKECRQYELRRRKKAKTTVWQKIREEGKKDAQTRKVLDIKKKEEEEVVVE